MTEPDKNDENNLPMSEEEAIKKQRKQFLIFAIAGLVMLVVAFFAGKTVREWVSSEQVPHSVVQVVAEVDRGY